MFQSFKDFLTEITHAPQADSPAEGAQRVQLAAAVLMVEVVRADGRMDASERAAALAALRRRFDLAPEALDALLDQAQDSARSAYDYQQFTSRINDAFGHDDKVRLVEALWQIAYADAHLDANENHAINKIAGLLHVTHGEYIAAKMRAKAAANIP
ncbi:MAG: TerB family tellurite resistance protein [Simplicispira sp.]|nr:TerB family tellurite resistance protein [Simplicispira sp.]